MKKIIFLLLGNLKCNVQKTIFSSLFFRYASAGSRVVPSCFRFFPSPPRTSTYILSLFLFRSSFVIPRLLYPPRSLSFCIWVCTFSQISFSSTSIPILVQVLSQVSDSLSFCLFFRPLRCLPNVVIVSYMHPDRRARKSCYFESDSFHGCPYIRAQFVR